MNRIKVEMSDDDETLRLLEVEYRRLGTTIDKFDEQRFKVKGWTITAAGALVALGINTRQIALLIAAAPITLFFALIEVLYLHIHVAIIERSNEVEGLIDLARRKGVGAVCESFTFGIGKIIKAHTFRWRDVPALLRVRSHITCFYLGIVLQLIVGAIILANIWRPRNDTRLISRRGHVLQYLAKNRARRLITPLTLVRDTGIEPVTSSA